MSRMLRALLLSAFGVLMLGCGEVPTRPPAVAVTLELSLSATQGSQRQPVTIGATVLNSGSRRVFQGAGCGCDAIGFEIRNENGDAVAYWNPCGPVGPACPCGSEPLEPGEQVANGLAFGGVYLKPDDGECQFVDAPAGTYTVIARYTMSTEPFGPSWQTVERSATFKWVTS